VTLDARGKTAARELIAAHSAYAKAHDAAQEQELARRAALAAVGAADEVLDAAIGRLADKLIGAGLTQRRKPLGEFSPHAVSELTGLAYAKEITAAEKLARGVRKAKPPKDVLDACTAVERAAAAVADALDAYDRPQRAWEKAIAARDALLVPWQKSLTRFRVLAKASLLDDEGAYQALVAEPDGIAAPKQKRKPKTTPKPPVTPA
jgi:hypothetical protein